MGKFHMREKEKKLFDTMLQEIGDKYHHQKKLTGFVAVKGMQSKSDLMIVGRSVNGWSVDIQSQDFKNEIRRKKFINEIFKESNNDSKCHMHWVVDCWTNRNGYNTKRSAFWRVIYKTMLGLNICSPNEVNWSSFVIWSNLYKISPASGYNPNDELCDLQRLFCQDILIEEFRQWQPKRIIFFTGKNWFDWFFDKCDTVTLEGKVTPNNLVQFKGGLRIGQEASPINIIVARHPQGKPEQRMTDEIFTSFKALCPENA